MAHDYLLLHTTFVAKNITSLGYHPLAPLNEPLCTIVEERGDKCDDKVFFLGARQAFALCCHDNDEEIERCSNRGKWKLTEAQPCYLSRLLHRGWFNMRRECGEVD